MPGTPGLEVGFEEIIHWFPRSPSLDREEAPKGSRITSALPTIRELTLVCAHRGSTAALPEASDNPAL